MKLNGLKNYTILFLIIFILLCLIAIPIVKIL
jgi:hypothetical protein